MGTPRIHLERHSALLCAAAHRAWTARCADFFRCVGLRRALRVAAPVRPPLRPIATVIWETVAGLIVGSLPVLFRTTAATNWLVSCACLRVRLGMSQYRRLDERFMPVEIEKNPTTQRLNRSFSGNPIDNVCRAQLATMANPSGVFSLSYLGIYRILETS